MFDFVVGREDRGRETGAGAGAAARGAGVKDGCRIVETVLDVGMRCAIGLRLAWDGAGAAAIGEPNVPLICVPSNGDGDSGLGDVGSSMFSFSASVGVTRLLGDAGGSVITSALSSLPLCTLAFLAAATPLKSGLAGTPSPLAGRANGLTGRSAACPAPPIWLGRRTNGDAFSGDKDAGLVGERCVVFVGDEVGVDARWKLGAGECEFWRRKGDWRTLPVSEAAGERVAARKDDCRWVC